MKNGTNHYLREHWNELTKRRTKCRQCGNYLYKGERRTAVVYDPYTYTTNKHTFMHYYHPKCWKELVAKAEEQRKKGATAFVRFCAFIFLFIVLIILCIKYNIMSLYFIGGWIVISFIIVRKIKIFPKK